MIKMVLTGPTGSGKGYISALLEERDIPTLDTDRVVHDLYCNSAFISKLCTLFGNGILTETGEIDRKTLADLIFTDPSAKKALLSIVYPAVRAVCAEFLLQAEHSGKKMAVVDAPQIFEAGFDSDFDLTVCVIAPKRERLARILSRDGITVEDADRRMTNQMSDEEYQRRCMVTLYNGQGDDIIAQIDKLIGGMV